MISLITGVGGFVGSHLASHLSSRGHKVYGLERRKKLVENVDVFQCDILDRDNVFEVFEKSSPDFVFHLAATSSVGESSKDAELTMKINVDGTRNVLDAASSAGAACLIVSTAHVYGIPRGLPIDENHPLNPISDYGKSRMEQEKLALEYASKIKIVISRSFNHTGPGQPSGFVCSDFAKQIAQIEKGSSPLMEVGSLESRRDFTDVRDVVRAYLMMLEKCPSGEIYNVCSGRAYSTGEILKLVLAMTEKKIEVKEVIKSKTGDIPILVGNNNKFILKTGWRPEIQFEKTLKDLLDYWRLNA